MDIDPEDVNNIQKNHTETTTSNYVQNNITMTTDESLNKATVIHESQTEILCKGHVFYNPVQEFNRDISISVISTFSKNFQKELRHKWDKGQRDRTGAEPPVNFDSVKSGEVLETGLTILEALSATGLRSIRYAKEVPGIKKIIANDLSKKAVESITDNIKHNKVENLVEPSFSDAMTLMYLSTGYDKQFSVIDLDPYGSPTRFLDGAAQSLCDGGLLLVTATDMAVLAGGTPEACFVKYGSIPLKTKACHEMAIRILLHTIESTAIRYGRYIQPLLSISADFYIRVFVRLFSSPSACKKSSSKQSMVYQCTGCDTLTFQPLGILKPNPGPNNPLQVKHATPTGPFVNQNCQHCGHRHHMGGPIWTAPIHDETFLTSLLQTVNTEPYTKLGTYNRINGMLNVISEELHDIPLYYAIEKICSVLRLEVVPILKFRSALLFANYKVSFSHACKSSIKTNAPPAVIWDILRCWAKLHPVKPDRFIEGSALKAILSVEPTTEYNLNDIHSDANPMSRRCALSRFPENPAAHWGPGTRATLMVSDNKMMKSIRNQNKHRDSKRAKRNYSDVEVDFDKLAKQKVANCVPITE